MTTLSTVQNGPQFAPVSIRNGWRPPRYVVGKIDASVPDVWDSISPVCILTDMQGEEVYASHPELCLAWDDAHIYLRGRLEGSETDLTVFPERAPDNPHFWEQDHIEFRLLRPDGVQVQFILVPDGRVFSNLGLQSQDGAFRVEAQCDRRSFTTSLCIPFAAIGFDPPRGGDVLRGQLAFVKWCGDCPSFMCFSANDLGFPQAERFGEFVFTDSQRIRLTHASCEHRKLSQGANLMELTFSSAPVAEKVSVSLVGADDQACTVDVPVKGQRAELSLSLAHPRFTHATIAAHGADGADVLAALSLRATCPQTIGADVRPHPRLQFDHALVTRIRSNLDDPILSTIVDMAKLSSTERENFPDDLNPDDPQTYDLSTESADWFRVCSESLLGQGVALPHSAAGYIWGLVAPVAEAAVRAVVESVDGLPDQLAVVCDAFNALLRREDFYNPEVFANLGLSAVGYALLTRRQEDTFTPGELAKLNRMLLQSAIECIHVFGKDNTVRPAECFDRWLITGNDQLISDASHWADLASRLYLPDRHTHLHEGGVASRLALAYDGFAPYLSMSQREAWVRLAGIFLDQYILTSREHAWPVTCMPNANPVGNGGCGLLALAFLGEHPLAEEALYWARKRVWTWLDYCSGADGGNTEGLQYWQYGSENCLRFAEGLEKALGTDDGIFDHSAFTKAMNNIRVSLCNDGCLHGVNDTIPMPIGMGLAWFCARRYKDPFALWYGDHAYHTYQAMEKSGRFPHYRDGFALKWSWRPENAALLVDREQPPLPTSFVMRDIQYGILRSGAEFDCAYTAGFKGARPPYSHHNQADAGAFWIDYRGERLLIDPGYHKDAPTDHCLPLVDGRGPAVPDSYTAEIYSEREGPGWRYLAIDSTPAYQGAAERVRRHMIMFPNIGIVIVDDIVASRDAPGVVTAQFQAGGETSDISTDHAAFGIIGTSASLRVDLIGVDGQLSLEEERSLHDTHWGYCFATCRMFPVQFVYQAGAGALITVVQDVASTSLLTPSLLGSRLSVAGCQVDLVGF